MATVRTQLVMMLLGCGSVLVAHASECIRCTDTQSPGMIEDGQDCATHTWAFESRCNKHATWVASRYCELSCEANGVGYTDPPCCACKQCSEWRSSYMISNGYYCETWANLASNCNLAASWRQDRTCAYSCDVLFDLGYGEEPCCLPSPSPPPPYVTPPPLTPYHNQGYANVIFVDAVHGNDDNDGSWAAPMQNLYYVDDLVTDGTAVYLLNGTYYNLNYGTGSVNNAAAFSISSVSNVLVTNVPGHSPKIVFDGSGGISAGDVSHFTITGLIVEGPNQAITYDEAYANRLLQDNYFSGRGIAVWSGSYIGIYDNFVSNCPNSGIRANSADYATIEDNVVANCTWWSSNAESGIVLADCKHIDESDEVKLVLQNNLAYGNINKMAYYNKYYDDPEYMAANQYSSVREHYGTSLQTFIIDGSGVYVTRNSESYLHGRFLLENNIAFGNGINGMVVHKTDRAIVRNNVLMDNGQVSKAPPADRQSYAGLTMNQATDVHVLENNQASAPFDDDYAFVLDQHSTFSSEFFFSAPNFVCVGRVTVSLEPYVSYDDFCVPSPPAAPSPPPSPAPPPCKSGCTDTRWSGMEDGQVCAGFTWAFANRCNKHASWVAHRYCELSCEANGVGYTDPQCCAPSPAPPPPPSPSPPPCKSDCTDTRPAAMVSNGQYCDTWENTANQCTGSSGWQANRYCELSCDALGVGYTEPPCCPPSPPAAPPPPCIECTDTRSDYMAELGEHCDTWSFAYTNKCNSDWYWRIQRFCEISCAANGNGYSGECCPPCKQDCTDTQSPGMIEDGQDCESHTWAFETRCNQHPSWVANRYCESSCAANGVGYTGPSCCACPGRGRRLQQRASYTECNRSAFVAGDTRYGTTERDDRGLSNYLEAFSEGPSGYLSDRAACVVSGWTQSDVTGEPTGTPYGCRSDIEFGASTNGTGTVEQCAMWCFREQECVAFSAETVDSGSSEVVGHVCWWFSAARSETATFTGDEHFLYYELGTSFLLDFFDDDGRRLDAPSNLDELRTTLEEVWRGAGSPVDVALVATEASRIVLRPTAAGNLSAMAAMLELQAALSSPCSDLAISAFFVDAGSSPVVSVCYGDGGQPGVEGRTGCLSRVQPLRAYAATPQRSCPGPDYLLTLSANGYSEVPRQLCEAMTPLAPADAASMATEEACGAGVVCSHGGCADPLTSLCDCVPGYAGSSCDAVEADEVAIAQRFCARTPGCVGAFVSQAALGGDGSFTLYTGEPRLTEGQPATQTVETAAFVGAQLATPSSPGGNHWLRATVHTPEEPLLPVTLVPPLKPGEVADFAPFNTQATAGAYEGECYLADAAIDAARRADAACVLGARTYNCTESARAVGLRQNPADHRRLYTPPPPPPVVFDDQEVGSSDDGAAIGGAIGGLSVLLACAAGGYHYYLKKKKTTREEASLEKKAKTIQTTEVQATGGAVAKAASPMAPDAFSEGSDGPTEPTHFSSGSV